MSNAVFPRLPGLTWDYDITPSYSTDIQTSAVGTETRIQQWPNAKHLITITYEFLFDNPNNVPEQDSNGNQGYTDLQTIVGFFKARQGSWDDFLLDMFSLTQNPADGPVFNQVIGTGDGTTLVFQLIRSVGSGYDVIQNLNGAPTIIVNGIVSTDWTVSSTGLVTFTAGHAPLAGQLVTASFSWYYRVRFNKDDLKHSGMWFQLYEAQQIELIQVPL